MSTYDVTLPSDNPTVTLLKVAVCVANSCVVSLNLESNVSSISLMVTEHGNASRTSSTCSPEDLRFSSHKTEPTCSRNIGALETVALDYII